MAYDRLDPVGELRGDVRMAQIVSTMVNLFIKRFGKKGTKQREPIEFMPKWDQEEVPKKQSIEEMKQIWRSIGKKSKDKKKGGK